MFNVHDVRNIGDRAAMYNESSRVNPVLMTKLLGFFFKSCFMFCAILSIGLAIKIFN